MCKLGMSTLWAGPSEVAELYAFGHVEKGCASKHFVQTCLPFLQLAPNLHSVMLYLKQMRSPEGVFAWQPFPISSCGRVPLPLPLPLPLELFFFLPFPLPLFLLDEA